MTSPGLGVPPAPPRPPKDPMVLIEGSVPAEDARRRVRLSIVLGVAGILTTILLPLGLLLDVAALVIGVRAWRRARELGEGRRRDLLGAFLGGIGVLLAAALVALLVTLWSPFSQWTDCVRGANTSIAEHNCKERLRAEVRDRIGHDLPGLG